MCLPVSEKELGATLSDGRYKPLVLILPEDKVKARQRETSPELEARLRYKKPIYFDNLKKRGGIYMLGEKEVVAMPSGSPREVIYLKTHHTKRHTISMDLTIAVLNKEVDANAILVNPNLVHISENIERLEYIPMIMACKPKSEKEA